MTDFWASATGTDIWEMADHHDPFSVNDSTTTSLESQPNLENDSSLTSSAHGHSTVSTAFLTTDFPNGPLSDSTDSDTCSDYTVHCSSDRDDVREDSGAPRFQFADAGRSRAWWSTTKRAHILQARLWRPGICFV